MGGWEDGRAASICPLSGPLGSDREGPAKDSPVTSPTWKKCECNEHRRWFRNPRCERGTPNPHLFTLSL
jgi:hypothetical protein